MLLVGVILIGGLTWAWFNRNPVVISPTCRAVAGPYTGEFAPAQARNAALIAGMAVKRGLPPRAATIALATAAQESKLRNLSYGDRDSLGLFQQRPSQGWGIKKQIMDPTYSAGRFYDHLVKVPDYETMPITQAAQRVQRSGHPEAYAKHEEQSRALAAAVFGQYPAALSCRLSRAKPIPDAAAQIVAAAKSDLGVSPAARRSGRLTFTFDDTPAGRQRAWGLAHWATACADAFGITAVHADQREWVRDRTELAWGPGTTGSATTVAIDLAT